MSTPLPGLQLIHGEDYHLVDLDMRAWLVAARARSEMEVEVFDAPVRLDDLRRSLTDVPMFAPERAVLVRDPPQLTERARRGADASDALGACIQARAEGTTLCLVLRGRVSPTHPVLAILTQRRARIVYHQSLRGRDLRQWLEERLRARRLRLDRASVDHLLRVCGSDTGRLDSELDKLIAFTGNRGKPPLLADVVALAGDDAQTAVWNVVERLLSRQPGAGAAAVDALLDGGQASQYLIATLAGQFRDLLVAQEALREHGGGGATLMRVMRLPSWRADRLVRHASVVPPALIRGWLRDLHRIDAATKAGEVNDTDALRSFALTAAAAI